MRAPGGAYDTITVTDSLVSITNNKSGALVPVSINTGTFAAPAGTALRLTITGDAGGEWVALRQEDGWRLGTAPALTATATVVFGQEIAWRLFTKGIDPGEARQAAHIGGDPDLAERV